VEELGPRRMGREGKLKWCPITADEEGGKTEPLSMGVSKKPLEGEILRKGL